MGPVAFANLHIEPEVSEIRFLLSLLFCRKQQGVADHRQRADHIETWALNDGLDSPVTSQRANSQRLLLFYLHRPTASEYLYGT